MAENAAAGAFRASPFIRASLWLHVAVAAAVVMRPRLWPWALAALIADHLAITAAGLWPRSALLGPNWRHLPAGPAGQVAITIDDGPHPEITPRVLDLLEARGARATFFCIGEQVQRYPQLAREIVRRQHAIENHSHRHLHTFSLLGPAAMAREVWRAQDAIAAATGETPRFFRAPAGLRNPFLAPVLAGARLQLASWTRRGFDTVSGDPAAVLQRLTTGLATGDILLLHDGHAARTSTGTAVILEVLPRLLDCVNAAGLRPVTLRAALAQTGPLSAAPAS